MKTNRVTDLPLGFFLVVAIGCMGTPVIAQTRPVVTSCSVLASVRTLNDAWNFEDHAEDRSSAYARRADEEGYAPIASLFRAMADSEHTEARNLVRAMKKLGCEPRPVLGTFSVGSTEENLRAEVARHASYADQSFPRYKAALNAEHFPAAMRTVADVQRGESSVVKYLREALDNLSANHRTTRVTYFVCSECGYMTKKVDLHVCKVCFHYRQKHVAVS